MSSSPSTTGRVGCPWVSGPSRRAKSICSRALRSCRADEHDPMGQQGGPHVGHLGVGGLPQRDVRELGPDPDGQPPHLDVRWSLRRWPWALQFVCIPCAGRSVGATSRTKAHGDPDRLPLAWPPCGESRGGHGDATIRWDVVSILGLEGKVTLITGAAAGIGAATAAMFAAEGATLALCDRQVGYADGEGPFRRQLDVRDRDAVSAFVADAVGAFGRIDVVVNNAGGTFASPVLDVSPNGEAALIAENFTQVTHLVRRVRAAHARRWLHRQRHHHRGAPGRTRFAVYAAMKAGQANLTKTLALELAPAGIRVQRHGARRHTERRGRRPRWRAGRERRAVSHGRRPAHRPLRHAGRRRRCHPLPGQRPGPLHHRHHPPRRRRQSGRRRMDPHRSASSGTGRGNERPKRRARCAMSVRSCSRGA